jgi:hypothetical protein
MHVPKTLLLSRAPYLTGVKRNYVTGKMGNNNHIHYAEQKQNIDPL